MSHDKSFRVNPGWRILLTDIGLRPADVLRRAGLPGDLFGREGASLSTDEYFRLWRGIELEASDPLLPLRIGQAVSIEAFDPPVFAAMCSPDLNVALQRIARYKRLILPMTLHLSTAKRGTTLALEWLDATIDPPATMVAAELVFFVQLARLGTREEVRPLRVVSPCPLVPAEDYKAFFGVGVKEGRRPTITFSAEDASRPFLTANNTMWEFFEPALRRQLEELDDGATTSERAAAALLELLPSGEATLDAVAKRLGVSTRTLQRRIREDGSSFQELLSRTREELARHYLTNSTLAGAEISFLLGYEDPNSFFRAFHTWTGTTPEAVRSMARA